MEINRVAEDGRKCWNERINWREANECLLERKAWKFEKGFSRIDSVVQRKVVLWREAWLDGNWATPLITMATGLDGGEHC
jgi:hypothetical protein